MAKERVSASLPQVEGLRVGKQELDVLLKTLNLSEETFQEVSEEVELSLISIQQNHVMQGLPINNSFINNKLIVFAL